MKISRSIPGVFALGVLLGALLGAAPASAEWTRITDIPATDVFSLWSNGDTLAAGVDTAVYVSTSGGATFRPSRKPAPSVTAITAVWVQGGRIYAGTFGQGVFVTDDLGATWLAFNEGLVGGILDTQLSISDLIVRGDSLYAATAGAGVYVRGLTPPSTWHPFGTVFEPNQASNVNTLALGGGRLLASAGANGMVFTHDSGDADWSVSNLDNIGVHAALTAQSAIFTGTGWVVGTNLGIFRSVAGQEPWTRLNPGLGPINWTTFATEKGHLFVAMDVVNAAILEESDDNGATLHDMDVQTGAFIYKLALGRNDLLAARADGLWRRPLGAVTGIPGNDAPGVLRFALAGPQPFGSGTRLRFQLPRDGQVTIELFDVRGRLVGERIQGWQPSGTHEIALDAQRLAAGVYMARLTAGRMRETVRLVHVR